MHLNRQRAKAALGVLLCLLGMVLTAQLGAWQLRRAALQDQRLAHMRRNAQQPPLQQLPCFAQAKQDPALQYHPVRLRGHFLPNTLVYIDNRQVQGRPAVQVVQAFVLENTAGQGQAKASPGCVVAVDRGYLLRNPAAPRQVPAPPPATQSTQPQSLQGWVVLGLPQSAELQSWFHSGQMHSETSRQEYIQGQWLWSNVQPGSYAAHLQGLGIRQPVLPFFVTEQPLSAANKTAPQITTTQQTHNTLPTRTTQQATNAVGTINGFWHQALLLPNKADKHRAYAAQWYGLCAVLGVATLVVLLTTYASRSRLKI